MKRLTTLTYLLVCAMGALSQSPEFRTHSNGLIYSERAMTKLSHVVDSLNLKYKTCNVNATFYPISQTIGHIVTVDKANAKAAARDMANQISLQDFMKKHPKAQIEKNVLVIRSKQEDYQKNTYIEFEHFNLTSDNGFIVSSEDISLCQRDFSNTWLFQYNDAKTHSPESSLSAFYFPTNFSSVAIPEKYSKMIGYADCLIDTTTTKLKDNLNAGWVDLPENWDALPDAEKAKLLDEMRGIRVVGYCSQDQRPRDHAVNIALLSAETYNWKVFLKAHLDIMNDRFERMADGSYAWAKRNTYIRELEDLNIQVADLIFGICFRMENPAKNHYYGSIGRVGRALAETKNADDIEAAMLSIVSDVELDTYNRLLFYFLFKTYNYHVKDESLKKSNQKKLATAVNTLPAFIAEKLSIEQKKN